MRHAKDGQFYIDHPERNLANNSAVYTEKPDIFQFMEEWLALARSGSGERGIINRESMIKSAAKCNRDTSYNFVVNPCGEVILRPNGLCNLTEVIIRDTDHYDSIFKKVKYATILGVLQSTLTKFNYVDDVWRRNAEEERLLGVSLTGICDNHLFYRETAQLKYILEKLRNYAHSIAQEWSTSLGISTPKAVTTIKPSGTVSQLVDSSSGIHPRYANYYIRRVRVNATDPLSHYLEALGINWCPEVGETYENHTTKVFDFPIASPNECLTRHNLTALEQLSLWKLYKLHWTDHNPSVTIYVDDSEWLSVGDWVYRNWDIIGGISFLPKDGGIYPLAPYEEISKEEYYELSSMFPRDINFINNLPKFETKDSTQGSREFACVGGACEL
jgi:ribonucleoside-diphosphate reductase alpha chain